MEPVPQTATTISEVPDALLLRCLRLLPRTERCSRRVPHVVLCLSNAQEVECVCRRCRRLALSPALMTVLDATNVSFESMDAYDATALEWMVHRLTKRRAVTGLKLPRLDWERLHPHARAALRFMALKTFPGLKRLSCQAVTFSMLPCRLGRAPQLEELELDITLLQGTPPDAARWEEMAGWVKASPRLARVQLSAAVLPARVAQVLHDAPAGCPEVSLRLPVGVNQHSRLALGLLLHRLVSLDVKVADAAQLRSVYSALQCSPHLAALQLELGPMVAKLPGATALSALGGFALTEHGGSRAGRGCLRTCRLDSHLLGDPGIGDLLAALGGPGLTSLHWAHHASRPDSPVYLPPEMAQLSGLRELVIELREAHSTRATLDAITGLARLEALTCSVPTLPSGAYLSRLTSLDLRCDADMALDSPPPFAVTECRELLRLAITVNAPRLTPFEDGEGWQQAVSDLWQAMHAKIVFLRRLRLLVLDLRSDWEEEASDALFGMAFSDQPPSCMVFDVPSCLCDGESLHMLQL